MFQDDTAGKKGHGKGIPAFYAWRAMVQFIAKADAAKEEALNAHLESLGADLCKWRAVVYTCQVQKAYAEGTCKIVFSVSAAVEATKDLVMEFF